MTKGELLARYAWWLFLDPEGSTGALRIKLDRRGPNEQSRLRLQLPSPREAVPGGNPGGR